MLNILEKPDNQVLLKQALNWQGLNLDIIIKHKRKLNEIQDEDILKLKKLGLEVKIEKGDKNGKF